MFKNNHYSIFYPLVYLALSKKYWMMMHNRLYNTYFRCSGSRITV